MDDTGTLENHASRLNIFASAEMFGGGASR